MPTEEQKAIEQAKRLLELKGYIINSQQKRSMGWIGRKGTSIYITGVGQKFFRGLSDSDKQTLADANLDSMILTFLDKSGVDMPAATVAPEAPVEVTP